MINRHHYCKNENCRICLEDLEIIENYLTMKTGVTYVDHLSKYRDFMDKRLGRSSETRMGWAVPEVFNDENIAAYIETWKERL